MPDAGAASQKSVVMFDDEIEHAMLPHSNILERYK
jgi:hypothetical protein